MTQNPSLDARRKRILYRATHRGTKESDAIIGGFFTTAAAGLPDDKLDEADELLDVADADLVDWALGRLAVPARWRGTLLDGVLAYYDRLVKRT